MPGGVDNSGLETIRCPDGYVLTYNYATGKNNTISRSSLSDSTGSLERSSEQTHWAVRSYTFLVIVSSVIPYSLRPHIALLSVFLVRPVGAEDKPAAKPEGAHKAALIRAGYAHVPLTVGPRGDLPGATIRTTPTPGRTPGQPGRHYQRHTVACTTRSVRTV
jgi:hypothetical protein